MTWKALLFALPLVVVLAGCGTRFEYENPRDTPKGGGLISGPEGAFTVYSDDKKRTQPQKAQSGSAPLPEDFREFQDYQDFQRWKTSAKDSSEYREFQDWREWKAYRVWKSQRSK
jgi:hypothetical protein